jgi:superoxide dismutase, Cu-Zn family
MTRRFIVFYGFLTLVFHWSLDAFGKWPKGTDPFARAILTPKSGSQTQGTVDFATGPNGLVVHAYVNNLPPGPHGIHIHEKGDCSAPDAFSAGEHFNPTGEKHGGLHSNERHIGDLGNIVANKKGSTHLEIKVPPSKSEYDWKGIIGKSIVIHEGKDDFKSQPSGNSGKRIACGLIQSLHTYQGNP